MKTFHEKNCSLFLLYPQKKFIWHVQLNNSSNEDNSSKTIRTYHILPNNYFVTFFSINFKKISFESIHIIDKRIVIVVISYMFDVAVRQYLFSCSIFFPQVCHINLHSRYLQVTSGTHLFVPHYHFLVLMNTEVLAEQSP